MSLKAKIEAVIYAAEEPVTLSQIVGLFGLEVQAELDRIRALQQDLPLDELPSPSEPDLLNEEILTVEDETDDQPDDPSDPPDPPLESPTHATPPEDAEPAKLSPGKETVGNAREQARLLRDYVRSILDELIRDYARTDKGLEIREVAGGFRVGTKPEYHDAVRGFAKSLKPSLKLSLQALETLAVVAYKQPVTAPEISEIRGVDSGGVLGSLMARKLVTTAGRKQVIGRPILYKTTKDFLLRFGLKDINELPSIEEFEKMAGELADSETMQEEISMVQQPSAENPHKDPELVRYGRGTADSITSANHEEEKDATEPQADGDSDALDSISPDGRLSGIVPPAGTSTNTDTSAAEGEIRRQQSESQE